VFLLGHWANYDDLESNLTIEELNATLEAMRRRDFERMKFEAAIHKGINLDDQNQDSDEERFRKTKLRAQARIIAGNDKSKVPDLEDQIELAQIGFGMSTEE
jgi:hypothetical protein